MYSNLYVFVNTSEVTSFRRTCIYGVYVLYIDLCYIRETTVRYMKVIDMG
jgi:hypothetical protein